MKKKTTIYKSEEGKKKILDLYDRPLKRLSMPYKDLWIPTSFRITHVIETGAVSKEQLLVFHGGNATSAYNLLDCGFLMEEFHLFAVDMIGHPGKSAETCLLAFGYEYGIWVKEVISGLGFETMKMLGGSFGAGIIVKALAVALEKAERAVLCVPSGIRNAPAIRSMSMLVPMILCRITGKDVWLRKCILPMAVREENITEDLFETARLSIDHAEVKTAMPSDADEKRMKKCRAPVLVMAAEKDCLFLGKA